MHRRRNSTALDVPSPSYAGITTITGLTHKTGVTEQPKSAHRECSNSQTADHKSKADPTRFHLYR